MKKVLLIISEYFSHFFSVALVGGVLFLLSTFISIPDLWMGGGRSGNVFHNNFGSLFLENFENNYSFFFFFPLLYLVLFFLAISFFVWIYYRHDNETDGIGFKNVILSLLMIFMLFYFPIRINDFRYKISEMKAQELAKAGGIIKISTIDERREFLNIYYSLYREGMLAWRHNPIAVVEYDLNNGILSSMDGENSNLNIEAMTGAVPGAYGSAVVSLKNDKHQARIYLSSLGNEDDRVWLVYGYEFDKK